jgi:hypothetical protein
MTKHARKLARVLLAGGAAAALVLGGGFTSPASADSTPSCGGVLSGGGEGPLTKSLVSITPGANAGDYTLEYRLDSGRPAGVYRIRDCVFIDDGTPGYNGEALIGNQDEKDVTFTSSNGGSTATFTQSVSGVDANDSVCDRAAVSGVDAGVGFTDKSNILCVTPNNPPVISESALAVTLPLAAIGAVGLVLLVQRRRAQATEA